MNWLRRLFRIRPVTVELGSPVSVTIHSRPGMSAEAITSDDSIWLKVRTNEHDFGGALTIFTSAYGGRGYHECPDSLAFLRSLRKAVDDAESAVARAHAGHMDDLR